MTISVTNDLSSIHEAHHTADYKSDPLVVRRGLPLKFSSTSDSFLLVPVPAHPKDRRRIPSIGPTIRLVPGNSPDGWALNKVSDSRLTLDIPVSAAVGVYTLSDSETTFEFVVIFNAYYPGDPVYMADDRERAEYVNNPAGLIWRGSAASNYPSAWDYSQFEHAVFLTAVSLVDRLEHDKRHDPVAVTRHLSAAVNVQDDGGVLVGRWDGEYDDGTPPSSWAGSAAILAQYWEQRIPVKYGQCWVYAGLLTSCCRALGIPCRTISNFSSAHDTDRPYNRAIDLYFDRDGELIESRSSDSIWNFHVWCSAWMRRNDLTNVPDGLDAPGWQAIDATPQEMSQGMFQMGPSPVKAIKKGLTIDYDTDFVIGEVNADVLYYWQEEGSNEFKVMDKRTRNVGRFISTKAVGSDRRNDVTLEYKYAEGTPEEREALANRPSADIEPEVVTTAVRFELAYSPRVRMGNEIQVKIKAKNTTSSARDVRFTSLFRATRYTGESTSTIGRTTDTVTIAPGRNREFTVTLPQEEYQVHLVRDVQTIKFNNSARVQEGGQSWAEECIVRVYGDDALSLSAPRAIDIGEQAVARAVVKNDFRIPLTKTVVRAEGSGVARPFIADLGTIAQGEQKEAEIPLEGTLDGDRVLVVTVDTEELQDLTKSVRVKVVEVEEMNPWERFWYSLRRRI
ncbi:unnamed protein product [Agarophyton chilense]